MRSWIPLIAQHRGRIANTAGDSVLAEFPSVVDAVKCAIAVQETLRVQTRAKKETNICVSGSAFT